MDKDHNLKMAYKAISTLHDFEFSYGAHFMTGVSGSGKGEENALAIANFFNETKPVSLINFSIVIDETTPLQKEIDKGNFVPATELENLEEDLIIIENLNLKEAVYDSFHDLIEFRVRGNLPHDKEKMVLKLKSEIDKRKKYSINPCFFL